MARREVRIGVVGMGFMGTTHLVSAKNLRGGRVAALVTSDPRKARGDFRGVRGNFGPGGGRIDLKGVRVYPTLDILLDDPGIDLVDICLPSHLHPRVARRCLAAGKHVLVEKPIALTPGDARGMLAESRRRRRLLLVAQVLKFIPEFSLLTAAIRGGKWGRLLALHLRRRISRPDWGEGSWFADPGKSGGMVVDLHIHDTDFMVHLFGRPRAVTSQGLLSGNRVDFLRTTYHFARGGPLLSAEASWINAAGLPFTHGYDAFFEKATCHFDSARSPHPVLYDAKGSKELRLKGPDGFKAELQEAVDSVRRGRVSDRLRAESAALSLEVCLAEEKSARTGKRVSL